MLDPGSFLRPGPIATVTSKSALFTVAAADRGTLFDNTGSYTISLTAAASLGAGFSFYTRCVSGTQTLDPNAAELINGAATYAVSNAGDIVCCIVNAAATAWLVQHVQLPSGVAITGGTVDGTALGSISRSSVRGTTGDFNSTLGVTGAATLSSGVSARGGSAPSSGTNQIATYAVGNIQLLSFVDSSQAADTKIWDIRSSAASFSIQAANDAYNASSPALTCARTAAAVTSVTINPATASSSTSTGALIVSGGAGISGSVFTGSGVRFGSGATTLNYYEEGTWTPTIKGDGTAGANTYTVQAGFYTRVGRLVFCQFALAMSVKDAAMAGNIQVGGLPFSTGSVANEFSAGSVGLVDNIAFGGFLGLQPGASATAAYLIKNNTGAASGLVAPADLTVTVNLRGTITYEA